MSDKLTEKVIDKMILELLQENKLGEIKEEKGGIETKTTKESSSAFGLSLEELTSIISTGTETKSIIKSSSAALRVFMKNVDINFDYSSASALANSFSFLDISDENILKERCESLGGLMSKMSLISGLVSIKNQFNRQAGGFVNEAYMATLMDGETVPVGSGGVEDIKINQGGKRIGISLKVKATEKLGGSFGNLCETLSIPYKTNKQVKRIRGEDTKAETDESGITYVTPPENPVNEGGLFYVNFLGGEDRLVVLVNRVTREDIIGNTQPDERGFYNIQQLNNILDAKVPLTNDKGAYEFKSKFGVKEYNKIMQNNLKDVYSSLSKLDAWFGDLKVVLSEYVSTLDKTEYDQMQDHLSQGASFVFKAFDLSSCEANQIEEQKQIKPDLSNIDSLISEAIKDMKKKQ